ncbi:hypothetical protein PR048_020988 [Dryococelus australis]|uniref:Uncharacterized protein n=1 Tax=Dryococelus australis TaxID=614101 RepID=A0ABQ9GWY9_9NEOP|nr:hypothetical protein PR048_020988 [Dryococelus australis]
MIVLIRVMVEWSITLRIINIRFFHRHRPSTQHHICPTLKKHCHISLLVTRAALL